MKYMSPEELVRYDIKPVPKPRMTRSDKWKKRKCVVEYFEYRDLIKFNDVKLYDNGFYVKFTMPMPKSWSKKKKNEMNGKPHTQKPDVDNLLKGLMDAVYGDDSHIHTVFTQKIWGNDGYIEICEFVKAD